ncbi:MAG: ion transporter [Zetaproteobacteria bacterium]|nr:MAG: ion transporter [Zetaproteobacteria bacterium]
MHPKASRLDKLRVRAYRIVEESETLPARLFNGFIIGLILVNVGAIVLESVEPVYQAHPTLFYALEVFSVAVFTIEYLLRVWVSVENSSKPPLRARIRYIFSFMALVDLLAILPFYLSMFVGIDTRLLRILRLLRIFKLTRHFQVLGILIEVLRIEGPALLAAVFIMLVLALLAAAGMYVVEHEAQPEAFANIPTSMWWAIVTLTTVGYGDIVPVTAAGKLLAIVITVLGVGMAALPAGIIAAGFTREMQKRREIYQTRVREALEDGFISEEEARQLERIRERLGLNIEDAQALTRAEFSLLAELEGSRCPHCGKPLFATKDDNQI